MKKVVLILSVFLLLVNFSNAQTRHPLAGTLNFILGGGVTALGSDYENWDPGFVTRGAIEYYLPNTYKSLFGITNVFGIKAFGGFGTLYGQDDRYVLPELRTNFQYAGGGFIYTMMLGESFFPYLFAGLSCTWYNPEQALSVDDMSSYKVFGYDGYHLSYNFELGFKIKLAKGFLLDLSGTLYFPNSDLLDDLEAGSKKDAFVSATLGLQISLFGDGDSDKDGVPDSRDKCPNTPLGVKVDTDGCPLDGDGDGVPDYLDKCPNTPKGAPVDKDGCPLDSDGDGVPDYLDKCPNTPKGVKVNEHGCENDADGDGVPDNLDKCPNTPKGVQVDKDGCPPDSDKDGVPDYKDKCPNTPLGAPVDADGCPLDSDKDGVPDYKDRCPNTPLGAKVDEWGCEEEMTIVLTEEGGVKFQTGKADILPSFYPTLDKIIETMNLMPGSKWRIEGHTDNVGSNKYNLGLSQRRAQSVVDYFVTKGISRDRLVAVGMGEDYPIATNSTAEGKAQNRRVEIKRMKL
ncbi:MAG: OmpA family protein [Ignavibacteriales bacterium]|nr:OmpA family protein [Ignavibacteriales bacterium]